MKLDETKAIDLNLNEGTEKPSCGCGFPLFPQINYLSHLNREHFRLTLRQNGLYPGQEEILLLIISENGIKPNEIAKMLSTSLAIISVSLKRLEKAGFIIKKPDKKDKRSISIFPSEKAENALENAHRELMKFEGETLKGLTEEELSKLRSILDNLIYNVSGVKDYSYKRPSINSEGGEFTNGKS